MLTTVIVTTRTAPATHDHHTPEHCNRVSRGIRIRTQPPSYCSYSSATTSAPIRRCMAEVFRERLGRSGGVEASFLGCRQVPTSAWKAQHRLSIPSICTSSTFAHAAAVAPTPPHWRSRTAAVPRVARHRCIPRGSSQMAVAKAAAYQLWYQAAGALEVIDAAGSGPAVTVSVPVSVGAVHPPVVSAYPMTAELECSSSKI